MKEIGAEKGLYVCIFGTHIYIYNIEAFKEDNKPSFNKKGFTSDDELLVAILDLLNGLGFSVVSNDSTKEG